MNAIQKLLQISSVNYLAHFLLISAYSVQYDLNDIRSSNSGDRVVLVNSSIGRLRSPFLDFLKHCSGIWLVNF